MNCKASSCPSNCLGFCDTAASLPVKDDGLEFLAAASERAQKTDGTPLGHVEEPEGSGFKGYTAEETAFDESELRPRAAFAVSPVSATFLIGEKVGLKSQLNFHAINIDGEKYGVFDKGLLKV